MMLFFFVFGEIGFEPFGKFTAGQHDASSAAFAFQPDIGAQARDNPLIGAAGMLLAQAQMVVELEVGKHVVSNRHP
jgi:hypothetical protein